MLVYGLRGSGFGKLKLGLGGLGFKGFIGFIGLLGFRVLPVGANQKDATFSKPKLKDRTRLGRISGYGLGTAYIIGTLRGVGGRGVVDYTSINRPSNSLLWALTPPTRPLPLPPQGSL